MVKTYQEVTAHSHCGASVRLVLNTNWHSSLYKAIEYSATKFLPNWVVEYSTAMCEGCSDTIHSSFRRMVEGAALPYVHPIVFGIYF